jgi:threonine dehydratase
MSLVLPNIDRAAEFLAQRIGTSPPIPASCRKTPSGSPILVEAENLMPTGWFKIRGATRRVSTLTSDECARNGLMLETCPLSKPS